MFPGIEFGLKNHFRNHWKCIGNSSSTETENTKCNQPRNRNANKKNTFRKSMEMFRKIRKNFGGKRTEKSAIQIHFLWFWFLCYVFLPGILWNVSEILHLLKPKIQDWNQPRNGNTNIRKPISEIIGNVSENHKEFGGKRTEKSADKIHFHWFRFLYSFLTRDFLKCRNYIVGEGEKRIQNDGNLDFVSLWNDGKMFRKFFINKNPKHRNGTNPETITRT